MRILIRTSKWAIWARRFGSIAVPLAVVPVFMHRERMIGSDEFIIVELIAAGFAAFALLLALGAFARLWITGDQGWSKATLGLFFSLICLVPFAFVFWLALRTPSVTDISTDFADPPALASSVLSRPLTEPELLAVTTAFPNARTRTYPVDSTQMFTLVTQLAEQRDWDVRAQRVPQTAQATGLLNAVATTLLGWRDEVAVRVRPDAQGSAVDMRSTALHAWTDLGENGRRIEEFLLALDQRITILLRDAPVAPAAPVEEAPAPEEPE